MNISFKIVNMMITFFLSEINHNDRHFFGFSLVDVVGKDSHAFCELTFKMGGKTT